MNTINLTVELGPKSQEKLDQILAALLQNGTHNCKGCVETAVAMTKDLADQANAARAGQPASEPATLDTGHPIDEVSPHGLPEPVAAPVEEDKPKWTKDDLTKKVQALAAPVEEDKPKWTKDDLTKKVQALAAPGTGKREKVREIVKSYAENVGAIPADKYDEVMDKLAALEQEG